MNEVKIYGVVLVALMVGAYLTWTADDDKSTESKVTIVDAKAEQLDRIDLFTKSTTVAVRFEGKDRYPWFEVDTRGRKRSFVGNEKSKDLVASFAPFEALRSLGKDLTKDDIAATELDDPQRKLILTVGDKKREFAVGGRTSGARDHYVRAPSSGEVFLVASKVLGDLEFPEGKFMQRKLRVEPQKDVEKVVVAADDKTLTAIQKNRLSPRDAFWTKEGSDEKNEALGNFLDKLDKITALSYPDDGQAQFDAGAAVLEASWYGDDGQELGRVKIVKTGEGKSTDYLATSTATRLPVKVSKFTVEQLESSLGSLFE